MGEPATAPSGGVARRTLILVGAKAMAGAPAHYGGVLTLSNGVVDYASRLGVDVRVVNTMRHSVNRAPLWSRLTGGVSRVAVLLAHLCTTRSPGVIVFSGSGGSFYERVILAAMCRLFRAPCVLVIVDGRFFQVQYASRLKRRIIGFMLRIPDRLAASGTNWINLFAALGVDRHRIATMHYWTPGAVVSATEVKHVGPGEAVHFVFVGWMVPEKGVIEILEVLEALDRRHNYRFTFIGGGTLLEHARARITELRLNDRVSAPGLVSPAELTQALEAAHVFVLPSYAEGFPIALIEAMSQGMPAICTDVGGISDSVQSGVNGWLIQPKDSKGLMKAMEFYLGNVHVVTEHSHSAIAAVRANHDPDTNCRALMRTIGFA